MFLILKRLFLRIRKPSPRRWAWLRRWPRRSISLKCTQPLNSPNATTHSTARVDIGGLWPCADRVCYARPHASFGVASFSRRTAHRHPRAVAPLGILRAVALRRAILGPGDARL